MTNVIGVKPEWSDELVWGSLTESLCNSLYSLAGFLCSSLVWGIPICCSLHWSCVSVMLRSHVFTLIFLHSVICGCHIQGINVWGCHVHQNRLWQLRQLQRCPEPLFRGNTVRACCFHSRLIGGCAFRRRLFWSHLFGPLHVEQDVGLGLLHCVLIGQGHCAVIEVVPVALMAAICCVMPWSNPMNTDTCNVLQSGFSEGFIYRFWRRRTRSAWQQRSGATLPLTGQR